VVAYWVGQLTAYYISLLLEEEWVLMALLDTLLWVLLPVFFLHLLVDHIFDVHFQLFHADEAFVDAAEVQDIFLILVHGTRLLTVA
jgi:hypothetical protein